MAHRNLGILYLVPPVIAGVLIAVTLSAPARAQAIGDEDERKVESKKVYVYRGRAKDPIVIRSLSASRTYLGVQLISLTPELMEHFGASAETGVMVSQVVDDSPAEAAGVEVGDILTAVDGKPMRSPGRLAREIASREAGEVVTLEAWREGRLETLTVTLAARKRPQLDIRPFIPQVWLDEDDGEGYRIVTPEGDFEGLIHLDHETLNEALDQLRQQMGSDHFKSRMRYFRQHGGSLLERLEELEERLEKLELELEELPRGDS